MDEHQALKANRLLRLILAAVVVGTIVLAVPLYFIWDPLPRAYDWATYAAPYPYSDYDSGWTAYPPERVEDAAESCLWAWRATREVLKGTARDLADTAEFIEEAQAVDPDLADSLFWNADMVDAGVRVMDAACGTGDD